MEVNGEKWIISKRHKTDVPFQVKLLDIPLQIIEHYKASQEEESCISQSQLLFNIQAYGKDDKELKTDREDLQQRISALENQNKELIQHIKTMEREHKNEHIKFNEYVDKIQRYFLYVEKLLPLIDFCRNTLKFSERVIQELCKLKEIRIKGDFYSTDSTANSFTRVLHPHLKRIKTEKDITAYA